MERRLMRRVSYWALFVLGAALLLWGVGRAAGPPPCSGGKQLFDHRLYNQAEKAYLEVLKSDPHSQCAAQGLETIQVQRCFLAGKAATDDQKKAALASEVKDAGAICVDEAEEAAGTPQGEEATSIDASSPGNGGWWHFAPDTLTWVLLVLGLGLVSRQVRLAWIRRRPGPIEVAELVDATGIDKLQPKSLTARMRERLGSTGVLPAAAVPGGQLTQNLADAVSASPLKEAGWMGKAIQFLAQLVWATNGHQVSGTLSVGTYAPKCAVTVQLSEVQSGATEQVATLWGESHEAAVRDAAFFVYQQVISHADVLTGTPVWRRWMTPTGVGASHFFGGRWEEELGNIEKAIEEYEIAAGLEPLNAVVRLRLGTLLEANGSVLDALEQYSTLVLHWPDLMSPSYRLAALEASHDHIVQAWTDPKTSQDQRDRLVSLIEHVEPEPLPRTSGNVDVKKLSLYFLDRAVDRWAALTEEKGAPKEGVRLRPFHLASKAALSVTRLQRATFEKAQAAISELQLWEVYRREKSIALSTIKWWRRPGWMARYNVACFFSRASSISPIPSSAGWRETCAGKAIEQLDRVVRDKQSHLNPSWISEDPDLQPIRGTRAFQAWVGMLGEIKDDKPDANTADRLQKLWFAWEILGDWTKSLVPIWDGRLDGLTDASCVQFNELRRWCELERRVWDRLTHWAGEPTDEDRRQALWIALQAAVGKDRPGDPKLPDQKPPRHSLITATTPGAQLQLVERQWRVLRSQALLMNERWADRAEKAAARSRIDLPAARQWAQQGRDTDQALADWAANPADGLAEGEFRRRTRAIKPRRRPRPFRTAGP